MSQGSGRPRRSRRLGRLSSKQGSDPSPPNAATLTRAQFIIFAQQKERFVGFTNAQLTRRVAREGRLHPIMIAGQPQACSDGINLDPARPLCEILMDRRQILESVYEEELHC
jgi:hypothetical protein